MYELKERIENAGIVVCFFQIRKHVLKPYMGMKQSQAVMGEIKSKLKFVGWDYFAEGSTIDIFPTDGEILRRHKLGQWEDTIAPYR